ncbi:precorrin-3B synthase [Pseudonocardia sp. KRD291]|uniref:precorrin-3B synthase n=1 Tax=Pseudonocardia sp. KRD291 TaxID=2792007 RepID=UPI001C49F556|nr:precorrin-3B synthase [Pseudonocardia sp. KRD291]MBW0102780.1 precorrin-3B synthase [Pseudonocardia sp. KRD291]
MPTPVRSRADACPGVLSPHDAADGALARIRLPGGVVTAAQLHAVADVADLLGDGAVHLTSRGNLQLRGLDRDDPALVRDLAGAGLLPSFAHEKVRNVLASPASGITGGLADVRGLAAALDRALCARPELAALPGRFLFAIDDGRGDVAAERPDLCWIATGADAGSLFVAGTDTGLSCAPADAPGLLLDGAKAFLALRAEHATDPGTRAWRTAELPDAAARIATTLRDRASRNGGPLDQNVTPDDRGGAARPAAPWVRTGTSPGAVGALGGGAVGAAPVLGELSAARSVVTARVGSAGARGRMRSPLRRPAHPARRRGRRRRRALRRRRRDGPRVGPCRVPAPIRHRDFRGEHPMSRADVLPTAEAA